MGIAEVLPRLPNLLRRIRETADAVVAMRPDALVTIDSPDFSLRVARAARKRLPGLRVIHYVAPSVWAWRPGRAAKMAEVVDHVLALLPFEPPYMEAAGHDLRLRRPPGRRRAAGHRPTRSRRCAPSSPSRPGSRCWRCCPGSRRGEVTRLAPVFAEVARRLRARVPTSRWSSRRRRRWSACSTSCCGPTTPAGRTCSTRAASPRRPGRRASARPSPRPTWRSRPRARSASSSRRPGRRW